jgi:hypothetical protein
MNLEDVSKREILDFKQFRSRVMDDTFDYLAPDVQDPLSGDKTGLHTIKREPAYDWVGYANAIWSPDEAGIIIPGNGADGKRDYTTADGLTSAQMPNSVFNMDTSESENHDSEGFEILRLEDF